MATAYISNVQVYGLRLESTDSGIEYDERGVPQLLVERNATFRLFGSGWTENTIFVLTDRVGDLGAPCEFPSGEIQYVSTIILF